MTNVRMILAGAAASAALAMAVACGGSSSSSSSTSPSGGCTPSTNPNTIVIQNNQVCPQTLTVALGSQVTMINNDSRVHEMDSDPHPEHTDCPALNQIDFLNPGQSRSSGNLTTARRCGFHDHSSPDNASLRGTITIQ
jgi:plastocyanin